MKKQTLALMMVIGLSPPSAIAVENSLEISRLESSVYGVVAEHLQDFLAAVVQPAEEVGCEQVGDRTICRRDMRIVQLLDGRVAGATWPTATTSLSVYVGHSANSVDPKETRLVVVVPSLNSAEGYVMLAAGPATDDRVEAVQKGVQRALDSIGSSTPD